MTPIIFLIIFTIVGLGFLTEETQPWWMNILCCLLDLALAGFMYIVWDWVTAPTWQWVWIADAVALHFIGLSALNKWYGRILARREWERTAWRRATLFRIGLEQRNAERRKWQEENM